MRRICLSILLITFVGCRSTSLVDATAALGARAQPQTQAGALWTQLTTPTIGTTAFGSFVYDAGNHGIDFLSGDGTPQMWLSADFSSWSQVSQSTYWPGLIDGGQLVYDSKNGYVWTLTQGGDGMDALYFDRTQAAWTPLNIYGGHPAARPDWGAAYDPIDDLYLFYGGGIVMEGMGKNDFWSLDPNPADPATSIVWTSITPTTAGPAGPSGGMTWDTANNIGRLIGEDQNIYTFDATTLTKTSATTLNGSLEGNTTCVAWDPGVDRWVAFGVPDASGNSNNVYEHDDVQNVWSVISTGGFTSGIPNPGLPPGFSSCQLLWYPPLGGLVLIGIVSGSNPTAWNAWVYKEGWTASGPPTGGGGSGGGGGGGTGGGGGSGGGGGGVPSVAPVLDLSQTFNHTGVVGQAWVPGFSGSQSSLPLTAGTPPFTVSVSAGDEPVQVDPSTLTLTWVPATAGAKTIAITVNNAAGSATITLDVDVIATTLPAPTAMLTATPMFGPAPLAETVTFVGTPGTGASILNRLIDFGDGSPPSYLAATTHVYSRVAGYQVSGTFWQNDGQQANSKSALAVTTSDGIVPPTVAATATPSGGMTVSFAAVAQPGTNPVTYYNWDFGDGGNAGGQNAQHTFAAAGSYSVVVVATDTQSFWGSDKVLVVLNGDGTLQPSVRAAANPATGDGPLLVTLTAQTANVGASVTSIAWDFGDGSMPVAGSTMTSVQHTYDAGAYTAHVTVQTASGSIATDEVPVMVTSDGGLPPQIITVGGATATVGQRYQYDADLTIHARAEGPVTYSTGPGTPGGLRLDPTSGLVTWTPMKSDVGVQRLSFLATSAGGVGQQAFDVTVTGGGKSGGCSLAGERTAATGAWPLVLFALAAAAVRRRRISR